MPDTKPAIPPEVVALAAALVVDEEGFRSRPYWDAAGGVWSIGYGFCTLLDGSPVTAHTPPLSQAECDALLRAKLLAEYMPAVVRLCGWPLTKGQMAALTSLAWNIGPGALANSSIPRLARAGAWSGVVAAMQQFIHAGGKVLSDLVGRRKREGAVLMGVTFVAGKRTGVPLGTPHPAAPVQGPQQLLAQPGFGPASQQSSTDDSAATAALNDASLARARA